MGLLAMAVAERAKMVWVPWLCAVIAVVLGIGCYALVPLHSKYEMLRYAAFGGLLHGNDLYGNYANINWFGTPVNARSFCLTVHLLVLLVLVASNVMVFLFFYHGDIAEKRAHASLYKRLGNSLLMQEMYKIFVMNKAVFVMVLFLALSWCLQGHMEYRLTAKESYYRDIMLEMEGYPDEEKEALIQKEQQRFAAAFEEIDKIDQLVMEGAVSSQDAVFMKSKYEMITGFYPQFEKVLAHYECAKEENIPMLYDTGYLQLFWQQGKADALPAELLLTAVAMILGFGGVMTMENERQSWMLLGTTYMGKKKVIRSKWILCIISAMVMGICSWFFRFFMINRTYPLRKIGYSSKIMLGYHGADVPLAVLGAAELMVHVLIYIIIMSVVLLISGKRERTMEVYVFSAICVVVPLLLLLVL